MICLITLGLTSQDQTQPQTHTFWTHLLKIQTVQFTTTQTQTFLLKSFHFILGVYYLSLFKPFTGSTQAWFYLELKLVKISCVPCLPSHASENPFRTSRFGALFDTYK